MGRHLDAYLVMKMQVMHGGINPGNSGGDLSRQAVPLTAWQFSAKSGTKRTYFVSCVFNAGSANNASYVVGMRSRGPIARQ